MCPGHYVHAIQAIGNFGAWPKNAFCADRDIGNNAFGNALAAAISKAQTEIEGKADFVEGVSFVFLSGWGSGHSFSWPRVGALSRWRVIFMEPEDAMFLGVCEDGKLEDIWRMDRQHQLVEAQGFHFQNANGLLNLFEWWRSTNHMFVPEHVLDAQPPATINFDTNLLLEARKEAIEALGRRCLPTPSGKPLLLIRLDPKSHFSGRQPVFASVSAAKAGVLIAAVESELGVVWVQLMTGRDDPHSFDAHETWSALLAWAGRLLDPFLRQRGLELTRPILIRFVVGFDENRELKEMNDAEIMGSVSVGWDHVSSCIGLYAAPAWHVALQRKDNIAEAVLAASFLSGVASATGTAVAPSDLIEFAVAQIGSRFARWRHSFLAQRPIDMLKAHGLVSRFRAIPHSAGALVKTGLGWQSRSRSDGYFIEGKQDCRAFLDHQHELLLGSLISEVAKYDRQGLVSACLSAIQAAQGEGRGWQESALALQSIHGRQEDFDVSFNQGGRANAVIRAASILIELAVAESPTSGGRQVGYLDLDELQAQAALLFKNADTIPAIEGGWIKPETGGLQNEFWSSQEMRTFASRRGDETGLAFNDDLARELTGMGLEAHASAKLTWCLNHQGTEAVKRLGDVDVLVFSPNRTRVWVIEAKDLKMCRTLGETARRLSEYQGRPRSNGKPDNLMKHLTRVNYIRTHVCDLQKRFSLSTAPSVSGMIVVGSPQPMEMITIPGGKDAITVRKDNLAAVPWDAGY